MTTEFGYDCHKKGSKFLELFGGKKIPIDEIISHPFKIDDKEQEMPPQQGAPPPKGRKVNLDDLSLQQLLHIYDNLLDELDDNQLNVILKCITKRVHKYDEPTESDGMSTAGCYQ